MKPIVLPKRIARRVKAMGVEQMKAVWDAPATFNRHSRRAAGLFGRLWKWDAQALGLDPELPPRYVRRHWREGIMEHPANRRQRRIRARIVRAMSGRAYS